MNLGKLLKNLTKWWGVFCNRLASHEGREGGGEGEKEEELNYYKNCDEL